MLLLVKDDRGNSDCMTLGMYPDDILSRIRRRIGRFVPRQQSAFSTWSAFCTRSAAVCSLHFVLTFWESG